jgi:PEP-CTERM motif
LNGTFLRTSLFSRHFPGGMSHPKGQIDPSETSALLLGDCGGSFPGSRPDPACAKAAATRCARYSRYDSIDAARTGSAGIKGSNKGEGLSVRCLVEERLLSDVAPMNLSITQPKEAKMAGIPSFLARGALSSAVAIGLAIASAGFAHAGVIYDATGGAQAFEGGDVIDPNAPGGVGVGPVVADRFFNHASTTLSSVTLNLWLNGAPLTGFTIDMWADSIDPITGNPGLPVFSTEQQIASVMDTSLTSSPHLYTYMPGSTITLAANTFYNIGIDTQTVFGDRQVTSVVFGNTVDPAVLIRPSVALGAFYFHTVGGVDPNSDGPYDLIVRVAAPEPSTWAMMLLGFAGLGFIGYRKVRRAVPIA